MVTEAKNKTEVIKYWAPDGKKYQADSWEEANEHCLKIIRDMKITAIEGGKNAVYQLSLDEISEMVDKMVAQRIAEQKENASPVKKAATKKGGK